ncbi:Acyl-coenzyme A thioesterase 1 [Dissostichus eleginoides]|uniref:Acyl-coenzyme A thioesterase 1 n=1 Tax=Dissostichus eleginoides TaxID=100907 RepID=A0AAD9F1B5_DISEL|nr:Acyl-coenzyme A thioesterase 1 [Dissostichus eleginoides]
MAYSQIRLKILPSVRCLFDKLVQVRVEGLTPHKQVELRSRLVDDRGRIFKASALYKADETGQVDVCRAPSLGGSYTGVEPMGLFWAMAPETPHSKLLKKNVLSPTLVEIEAMSAETGELLASETNERGYMTEGMKRIPVQEGRIRGVLFIPPGEGPFPGIVDLYTFGGRLTEPRASLLANKGFVVLALAYMGYEDLPKNPKKLDLEYFDEAVTYLRRQPEVKGPGIGIISISHSGGLALSMSSFLSGISATVCINGCNANTNRASQFPIERASCHFLFAVSEDDHNWNSVFFANQAAATLRTVGSKVAFGGEPKAHSEAQLDLWERVQQFFKSHLDNKSRPTC